MTKSSEGSHLAKVEVQPAVLQAAFVGVVQTVLPVNLLQVLAENRFMGENHLAVVAAVRLDPAVEVEVILQRALLGEGLAANLTLERLDAGVDAHVPVQVALLREGFPTQEAHEQLVHLEVVGIVLQLAEDPRTFGTLVVPLTGVVVVPWIAEVLVGQGGAEWEAGHAWQGGDLAATTVHGGVDEGVLRFGGVKGGRGAAGEVAEDGGFGRVVDRLHFDYGYVTVYHTLPGTPAWVLHGGLGLQDDVVVVLVVRFGAVVVVIQRLHLLDFLMNSPALAVLLLSLRLGRDTLLLLFHPHAQIHL